MAWDSLEDFSHGGSHF